jgi:hypothetical protein
MRRGKLRQGAPAPSQLEFAARRAETSARGANALDKTRRATDVCTQIDQKDGVDQAIERRRTLDADIVLGQLELWVGVGRNLSWPWIDVAVRVGRGWGTPFVDLNGPMVKRPDFIAFVPALRDLPWESAMMRYLRLWADRCGSRCRAPSQDGCTAKPGSSMGRTPKRCHSGSGKAPSPRPCRAPRVRLNA